MMRKAIYSAILLFVLSYSTANAQTTFTTGIQYNDFIVAEQLKIGDLIAKFNDFIGAGSFSEAKSLLSGEMKAQARLSIGKIKKMPAYNGDVKLRDTAIALFTFYMNCFDKQYPEMLEIVAKGESMTTADSDRLDVILQDIIKTENGLDEAFANAQKAFAEKNGFTLSE